MLFRSELTAVTILQRLQQQTTSQSGLASSGFPDQDDIFRLGDELMNSSSANPRICLRFTPGWRAKGNVSSDQRSGRRARWSGVSGAPICLSAGRWRRSLLPVNRA